MVPVLRLRVKKVGILGDSPKILQFGKLIFDIWTLKVSG